MSLNGTGEYLRGLLHMAAACSMWIGRSWVDAFCYDAAGFPEKFVKDYRLRRANLELIPAEGTLEENLGEWLGPEQSAMTGHLAGLIRRRMGEPLTVWRAKDERKLNDALSGSEGGVSRFCFVEDALFLRAGETVAVLIMGNNE